MISVWYAILIGLGFIILSILVTLYSVAKYERAKSRLLYRALQELFDISAGIIAYLSTYFKEEALPPKKEWEYLIGPYYETLDLTKTILDKKEFEKLLLRKEK